MADLKPAVDQFVGKWTSVASRADAAGLCAETKKLFALLGERIKRENTQFYPLVKDRAQQGRCRYG